MGTRFLYMVNLIWECRTHECKTVKDVQALSELYTNCIVAKCEGAVATFLECNKNICTNKQLMKDLVTERVTLDKLCSLQGYTPILFLLIPGLKQSLWVTLQQRKNFSEYLTS